jgi:hypothetical protein
MEIIRFLNTVGPPGSRGEGDDQRERFSTVLAQELDDDTMERLRVAFAARNVRGSRISRRGADRRR